MIIRRRMEGVADGANQAVTIYNVREAYTTRGSLSLMPFFLAGPLIKAFEVTRQITLLGVKITHLPRRNILP